MTYTLNFDAPKEFIQIELPSSKSISNRLLIMQALSAGSLSIENLSKAEDTELLQVALNSTESLINVGMAGTACRFLTAYYAVKSTEIELDGAARMRQRPIKVLVDVLRALGGNITYLEKQGFPPLKIVGAKLEGGEIEIEASVSSQYISAILLIAPYLNEGLTIALKGSVVSLPYIDMSLKLMNQAGAIASRSDNKLVVKPGVYQSDKVIRVEPDWSSAAFFYQFVALSGISIELKALQLDSIQGDKHTAMHFEKLGVMSIQTEKGIVLSCIPYDTTYASFDLLDCPDLVPAIAVTASQLIEHCQISGVKTLRIKESNRVVALQAELAKVKAELVDVNADELEVFKSKQGAVSPSFETHNDHRMAMCLAPLVCLYSGIEINSPEVVSKSFPSYWDELKKLGVQIS